MTLLSSPDSRLRGARNHLLEPEILTLQGIAACAFLLSFGLLILALPVPAYWLPGQFARLLGVLWALPAAIVMTHRHARLNEQSLDVQDYLARVRIAHWAALGLALIALPCAQWHFQEKHSTWLDARLLWPMLLSIALCWWAGLVANHLVRIWYVLQRRHEHDLQSLGPYDYAELSAYWDPIDRGLLITLLWTQWFMASLGLAVVVLIHAAVPVHGQDIPFIWSVLAFLGVLAIGPVLIGRAVAVRWPAQWTMDRVSMAPEVTSGWGRMALTVTLLAGAGTAAAVGLFISAHRGLLWLAAQIRLPVVTLPSAAGSAPIQSAPAGSPASYGPAGSAAPIGVGNGGS
ncbi:MAG TPA: hypothetical protein VHB98_08430, partial [Chloroflexota bacterium]|nr:hypothetical protein [Chloroflexota bacterium]